MTSLLLRLWSLRRAHKSTRKVEPAPQTTGHKAKKSPRHPNLKNELTKGNSFEDQGAEEVRGRFFNKRGTGNRVIIGAGSKFRGTIEFLGDDNTVRIGEQCHYRGRMVVKGRGQTVSFGDHSTTVDVYILCQEGCDVRIGRWCMFSRNIEVRTSDAHSVIDRVTLERINKPESIVVGDHVWVGLSAIVNKGACIAPDSIVAAGAFVNRAFDEEGVILAGTPAAIVKRGVTWHRSQKATFDQETVDHWRGSETS